MTAEEMWQRALACESRANMFEAKRRRYRTSQDAEAVKEAVGTLEVLPLEIVYRPGLRPRELKLECQRLKRAMEGLRLVVVDYFNLMRGDRHEKEHWREMQEVILSLKQIAGELGTPILLLAQLNREVDDKHCPSLAHLRDTGAAEEHANNVLFLWQPETVIGTDWHEVELLIAKQRNGPANLKIGMKFNKTCCVFST
jgi:replicative DNA helicase